MKLITKQNGKLEQFSANKIKAAVRRAMYACDHYYDKSKIVSISNDIAGLVSNGIETDEVIPNSENISEVVELLMMDYCRHAAKEYILYRQKHKEEVRKQRKIIEKFKEATKGDNPLNSNANYDEAGFTGRLHTSGEVIQKYIALEELIPEDIAAAHKEMRLYTHDLSFYNIGVSNCATLDFSPLLEKGFWTRNSEIRGATSFKTACHLVPIIMQLEENCLFGGLASLKIDFELAVFVRKSWEKILNKNIKRLKLTICPPEWKDYDYVIRNINIEYYEVLRISIEDLEEELKQGAESLVHNLTTLTTRVADQLPFSSLNFLRDTSPAGRAVSRAILNAQLDGVGPKHLTPIFPILVAQLKDGVNKKPGDPNYDLKQLAIKCTAKRIFPNYANCDCDLAVEDEDDPNTFFGTMGCRTLTGKDINAVPGQSQYKRTGRGNACPVTIILPSIAIPYGICNNQREKPDIAGFLKEFEKHLKLAEKALLHRFNHMCNQKGINAMFQYKNETLFGGGGNLDTPLYETLMHETLAVGFIGVAEMCQALFGTDHYQSKEAYDFALNIVKRIRAFTDEATQRNHLNFSCYATPAENLCFTALKVVREKFGVIPGVTDKEFFTNSFHIPVWYKIPAWEKIDLEAPFTNLCNGGTITYVEIDGNGQNNPEALEKIINYAMSKNVPYFALNVPLDSCLDCGYDKEILQDDVCPQCGSNEIQKIRRITGYISMVSGNKNAKLTQTTFNKGKLDELSKRVKHSQIEGWYGK